MAQVLKWVAFGMAALLVVVLAAAIGAHMRHADAKVWHYSGGPAVRQERSLEPFDAILVNNAADVDITVGGPQSVAVEADQNSLSRVGTTVQGHTLVIGDSGDEHRVHLVFGRAHPTPRLTIVVPALSAVSIEGAGRFRLHHVQGDALSFDIEGAGEMSAEGKIGSLKLRIDGAGKVDTSDLDAGSVEVDLDGAGTAIVRARDTLSAKVDGFGRIEYLGNPRSVDKQVSGLGSVRPASGPG